MAEPERWQNRITHYGEEAPDQFLPALANWRVHPQAQQQALGGVLSDIGWIAPVIVSERSGRLVDGHLRVELALSRGEPAIPVAYVDLSEAEEAEALLTFDPLAAMAVADKENLDALLRQVESSDAAVQALLASLAAQHGLSEPAAADDDGLSFDPDAMTYQILITCDGEEQQRELIERFNAEGLQTKAIIV